MKNAKEVNQPRGRAAPMPDARRRPLVILELTVWETLADIANREGTSVAALVDRIVAESPKDIASAIDRFAVGYFRDRAARRLRAPPAARRTDR